MGAAGLIFTSLSLSVSFLGKTWWVSMLGARPLLVLLLGFTLYSDDQAGFVCNTLQPGCSAVCFDAFAPVSVHQLWLLHAVLLGLTHVLFATYVSHRVLSEPDSAPFALQTSALSLQDVQLGRAAPRFHCSYVLTVVLRIVLEAVFGACQCLVFGLSVPKSFLCYEAPCVSGVECYISKPTEKTLMLHFMLGASSSSIALSLLDLVSSIQAMSRWRRKAAMLGEDRSRGERSSVFTTTGSGGDEGALSRRTRPSGSSNNADRDGNLLGGSKADGPGPKVSGLSTIPTGESAPVSPHLRAAPWNPRGPTLQSVTDMGLHHPAAANVGQHSAEPQDKRAWV